MIPFICFDLSGGGNIAGSNVLVGGPGGQLDFLSVAGYNKLGLPGTMVPNQRDGQLRRCEPRAALSLRQRAPARHQDARERGGDGQHHRHGDSGAVAERHQHNPHNPMYGIWQVGARGALARSDRHRRASRAATRWRRRR
jgi:hypothetical protein